MGAGGKTSGDALARCRRRDQASAAPAASPKTSNVRKVVNPAPTLANADCFEQRFKRQVLSHMVRNVWFILK
jgi:hypothetical protein